MDQWFVSLHSFKSLVGKGCWIWHYCQYPCLPFGALSFQMQKGSSGLEQILLTPRYRTCSQLKTQLLELPFMAIGPPTQIFQVIGLKLCKSSQDTCSC